MKGSWQQSGCWSDFSETGWKYRNRESAKPRDTRANVSVCRRTGVPQHSKKPAMPRFSVTRFCHLGIGLDVRWLANMS
jgi:hypothetical protein